MNWLYRVYQFMAGRRGVDQLTIGLTVLFCILILFSNLIASPLLWILSNVLLIFAIYRIFSRNLQRRQRENDWFLRFWSRFSGWFRRNSSQFHHWQQRETDRARDKQLYRYYKCPHCRNVLHSPGKGKIQITCPLCGTEFVKKT